MIPDLPLLDRLQRVDAHTHRGIQRGLISAAAALGTVMGVSVFAAGVPDRVHKSVSHECALGPAGVARSGSKTDHTVCERALMGSPADIRVGDSAENVSRVVIACTADCQVEDATLLEGQTQIAILTGVQGRIAADTSDKSRFIEKVSLRPIPTGSILVIETRYGARSMTVAPCGGSAQICMDLVPGQANRSLRADAAPQASAPPAAIAAALPLPPGSVAVVPAEYPAAGASRRRDRAGRSGLRVNSTVSGPIDVRPVHRALAETQIVQGPETQNPETQNPEAQNPGTQNPGTQNPETQHRHREGFDGGRLDGAGIGPQSADHGYQTVDAILDDLTPDRLTPDRLMLDRLMLDRLTPDRLGLDDMPRRDGGRITPSRPLPQQPRSDHRFQRHDHGLPHRDDLQAFVDAPLTRAFCAAQLALLQEDAWNMDAHRNVAICRAAGGAPEEADGLIARQLRWSRGDEELLKLRSVLASLKHARRP